MRTYFRPLTLVLMLFAAHGFSLNNVWSPPATISATLSSINVVRSPLAIDTHSNALVGWIPGPGPTSTNQVFSSNLPSASFVWNAQELVFSDTPPQFPAYPLMFTDMSDEQTALFGELDLGGGTVTLFASRRPGGTSGWPTPIALPLTGFSAGGSGQQGKEGNILAFVAVAAIGFSPPYTLELSTLMPGDTSWSPITIIDVDNSSQPVLAASIDGGDAVLVWRTNVPSLAMHGSRYLFNSHQLVPTSDIPLPAGATDVLNLQVEIDSFGNAVAFYTVAEGAADLAYTATLLAGSNTWSTPILVSNPANLGLAASIGIDAVGNSVLLWGEIDTLGNGYIFAADLPLGGVPSTNLLTGPIASVTNLDPSSNVAVDSFGNAVAIWGVVAGGVSTVQVDSKAAGQSWVAPITLSSTGVTPKVVLSDQETAVAVWIDSVTGFLFGSKNAAIFPLQTPNNFVGTILKNKFLNATEYVLSMHWDPSPLLHIVSYEIRNNGNLVAVVPGSGPFEFEIYLPSKHATGVYTLTSIATNGNQSVPATLRLVKKGEKCTF